MKRRLLRNLFGAWILLLGLAVSCATEPYTEPYTAGSVPNYVFPESVPAVEGKTFGSGPRQKWACTVLDDEGKPMPGARVDVHLEKSVFEVARFASSLTGEDGACSFESPPGDLIVRVTHADCATHLRRLRSFGTKQMRLEFRLDGGTEIAVTVVDDACEPVAGAEVAVLSNLHRRFFRSASPIPILAFLFGKMHGLYDLNLLTSGLAFQERVSCDDRGTAALRVPSAFWEPVAWAVQGCFLYIRAEGFKPKVIHLHEPAVRDVNVALETMRTSIRGRVVDDEGEPVEGCFVVVASRNPGEDEGLMLLKTSGSTGEMTGLSRPWFAGPTGADGRFVLPLPEGEEVLKYAACIKPGWLSTILYDVPVAELGEDGGIRLSRGRTIRGAVFGR
jgi:protocatechuate 3,4-dioxygenase beta subunit